MGLFTKPIYKAEVHFFGATDRQTGEIRARVDAPTPPEIGHGRNALALLTPLSAVKFLCLMSTVPQFVWPMITALDSAVDALLDESRDPKTFSIQDPDLPRYVTTARGKGSAVWRVALMPEREVDRYWVKGHGPARGGPSFALFGVLGLIETVARNYSYEETVLPVAAAIKALTLMAKQFDGEWQQLGGDQAEMQVFGQEVAGIVSDPDPRAALATTRRSLEAL